MPLTAPPTELERYYDIVAPFYDDEMAARTDIPAWRDLVERIGARSVLDLGTGGGRVARALADQTAVVGIDILTALVPREPGFEFVQADLRGLPFADGRFDLAIAANDPFAHLLADADRAAAVGEAARVARQVVIDGLSLTAGDDARARATGCVRETVLPDGLVRQEIWRAAGEPHRYTTAYRYVRDGHTLAEASTEVRAWSRDDPALRGRWPRIAGGLDGRAYDPGQRGFVISIGGQL